MKTSRRAYRPFGIRIVSWIAAMAAAPAFAVADTTPPAAVQTLTTETLPQIQQGIWIGPAELAALPRSGAAFNAVNSAASGSLGTPNLSDQDSPHPERAMACALIAVATDNASLRDKAVAAIVDAIGTEANPDPDCASPLLGARGLAMSRNLIGYAIAADVLNLRPGGYDPLGKGLIVSNWINAMRNRANCSSNGASAVEESLVEKAPCASNGCSLQLASRVAAAAYLDDRADLDRCWVIFRREMGDGTANPDQTVEFNSYSAGWRTNPPYVVNPRGAVTGNGYPADGVLSGDQGRGGDPPASPDAQPGYTQYPWEGLQGLYAAALILDRMGYRDANGRRPWQLGDNALLRAVQYQADLQSRFGGSWYDSSRAAWVKSLAGAVYGFRPYAVNASGGGRNVDWTQWTHASIPLQ